MISNWLEAQNQSPAGNTSWQLSPKWYATPNVGLPFGSGVDVELQIYNTASSAASAWVDNFVGEMG